MFAPDEYVRGPCKVCGCHTEEEAGASDRCRPHQTPSGDYVCGHSENDVDAEGYFIHPTEEALKRLDEWVTEQARKEGWP